MLPRRLVTAEHAQESSVMASRPNLGPCSTYAHSRPRPVTAA